MPSIVHQRQGDNECLPTSIAMLAGVPKDDVIAWGLDYARRARIGDFPSWSAMEHGHPTRFWNVSCPTMDHFLGRDAGKVHYRALYKVWCGAPATVIASGRVEIVTRRSPTLLHGRGLLTIRRGHRQHAVAFQDGMIYDGNGVGAETFAEFIKGYPRYRIACVQYFPEGNPENNPVPTTHLW